MVISQAAPLYGATPGYLQGLVVDDAVRALIPDVIPLADTVVNPLIIGQNIGLFIIITLVARLIMPKKEERILEVSDAFAEEILTVEAIEKPDRSSPAAWINSSPLLNIIIGGAGLIWGIRLIATSGIVITSGRSSLRRIRGILLSSILVTPYRRESPSLLFAHLAR